MLLYGRQSTNEITPLLVDSLGRVIMASASPSSINPIPGGIRFENFNLPAGASNQTIATVPAGQVWRIKVYGAYYAGTVAGVQIHMTFIIAGIVINVDYIAPPINAGVKLIYPDALLGAGDKAEAAVFGATVGNDFIGFLVYDRVQ